MQEEALYKHFGFQGFKTGQRQVVEKIMQGRSSLAVFPTGAGKSLCYQLPAVMLPGMTLVVSPLLSLMKDQVDFLDSKSIPAARLDSSLTPDEYADVVERAKKGELRVLMIAVERFKNERFRQQLKRMSISLLVVDEAHCISEWGHNLRPDYPKLP
ncbi:MAG: DEAD/DEAH box helicase, partial [Thermodesulfobacteriota bacterium]